ITQFLKKNPKETIIMRLKDEQNSKDKANLFFEAIK
ncbi:hypothetical protein, partial [Listeria innocua]